MARAKLVGNKVCTVCLCMEFDKNVTTCYECGNNEFYEITEAQGGADSVILYGNRVRFERREV